jgi:hypothetical protein
MQCKTPKVTGFSGMIKCERTEIPIPNKNIINPRRRSWLLVFRCAEITKQIPTRVKKTGGKYTP